MAIRHIYCALSKMKITSVENEKFSIFLGVTMTSNAPSIYACCSIHIIDCSIREYWSIWRSSEFNNLKFVMLTHYASTTLLHILWPWPTLLPYHKPFIRHVIDRTIHNLWQKLLFPRDWLDSYSVEHLKLHCKKILVSEMCILKFWCTLKILKTQKL